MKSTNFLLWKVRNDLTVLLLISKVITKDFLASIGHKKELNTKKGKLIIVHHRLQQLDKRYLFQSLLSTRRSDPYPTLPRIVYL